MLPKENRAAVFNGPRSITMERLPLAQSNDGSAILKILSCAVCGYDVRVYNEGHRKVHPPIILGHEICAETMHPISNLGDGNLISEGTRVAYRHLFLVLSVTTVPANDTTCVIISKRLVRALMEVLQSTSKFL